MALECPYCGDEMIPGIGYVHGALLGFLFCGASGF